MHGAPAPCYWVADKGHRAIADHLGEARGQEVDYATVGYLYLCHAGPNHPGQLMGAGVMRGISGMLIKTGKGENIRSLALKSRLGNLF